MTAMIGRRAFAARLDRIAIDVADMGRRLEALEATVTTGTAKPDDDAKAAEK